MAAPTQPTKTTLCTEALKRYLNGSTPEAADITRAESYGLEKVKADIMQIGRKWSPLLRTAYGIALPGMIPNPADFDSDLSVSLCNYVHASILTGVTNKSIVTLSATENATQIEVMGKLLITFDGSAWDTLIATGSYDGGYDLLQGSFVSYYDSTTKEASLAAPYATLPVTGDSYMIVNNIKQLTPIDVRIFDSLQYPGKYGTPERYVSVPDDSAGKLAFIPASSTVQVIQRRYYADLLSVDITGTLYNTILRRWQGVFEQGVFVWALGEDDNRYQEQSAIYRGMLNSLMINDLDGYTPTKQ